MLLLDFFSKTGPQLVNNLRFLANGHVTYHVTYQHNIYTLNATDDEFFMCAKF